MSLTITRILKTSIGDRFMIVNEVAFDSSYPSGGESLLRTDLGFAATADPEFHVLAQPKGGRVFEFDYSGQKLLAYEPGRSSSEYAYTPGGGDIKGATAITAAMGTADQASDVVNSALNVAYQSFTTISGASGSFGTITNQPALGRAVNVAVKNASGGSLNLFTGTMTITVTGKFRGATQTEAIACTLTGGQVAVANNKFRAFAGSKPFDSITSVAIDATSLAAIAAADGALQIAIGPSVKIGFPVAPQTGADTDVLTFSVNAAPRAIASNSDYTNQTFSVGTIADGDDISIVYKVAGGEVADTTDLSAVTAVRVTAFGKYQA
jgi:hypothetical protein